MGLSKKFLEAKGGKLLLLAGTDRLDKELIIGQMQGSSLFPSLTSTDCGSEVLIENIGKYYNEKEKLKLLIETIEHSIVLEPQLQSKIADRLKQQGDDNHGNSALPARVGRY